MKMLTLFSTSLLSLTAAYSRERVAARATRPQVSLSIAVPCKDLYMESSVLEQRYLLSFERRAMTCPLTPGVLEKNKAFVLEKATVQNRRSSQRNRKKRPSLTIDENTYKNACFDRCFRTRHNPPIASHALIIGDEAYFYTPPITKHYQDLQGLSSDEASGVFFHGFYQVPEYTVLSQIYDSSANPRHSKYIGRTKNGLTMYGTHVLELTIDSPDFLQRLPAKLVSFYPLEASQLKPHWACQETISPLFSFPHGGQQIKELSRHLEKQFFTTTTQEAFCPDDSGILKPFPFRVIDNLEIDLKSLIERKKIPRRKPSQKSVMGHSSSQEMMNLLKHPLAGSLNVNIRNFIANCITAYTDNRIPQKAEWLHLVAFGCTPMWMNPQITTNLVSSSTCLNTEQMLAESILQCLGQRAYELSYQNTDLRLSIKNSFFELIPTTNIASYMSYNTRIELPSTGRSIETHQEYASLQPIALRHKVDVGAACVIFSRFLEGQRPCHKTRVRSPSKKHFPA